MEWITLTATAMEGIMTEAEKDLSTADLGVSIASRLDPIITNLTAEIRSMIATWAPNSLSADTTKIPPGFAARALIIARWRLLTSIPDYQPDDARRLEYDQAEKFFGLVATGKIRPEPATDAVQSTVPNETPAPSPKINARTRRYSRDQQNGI